MVDAGCGGEYPEPPRYEPICTVHQSVDYVTEASDQAKADAQLIAAVAELLDAAEWAFAYLTNPNVIEPVSLANKLIQALAKAGHDADELAECALGLRRNVVPSLSEKEDE
jgi:hypothetical protein